MSSPHSRIPPLPVRERAACMCAMGDSCSTYAPGHALHLIQARLASATPTDWIDAIVTATDAASGDLTLRTLEGDEIILWNATGAAAAVAAGSPVALHGRYDVLAAGRALFNCLRG